MGRGGQERGISSIDSQKVSDAEIAAAAGIADEDGDLAFVRSYIDRAPWRASLDDDILEEFLKLVYGSGG